MGYTNVTISITLDENGVVTKVVDEEGGTLEYADDEKSVIEGTQLHSAEGTQLHSAEGSQLLAAAPRCCWRKISGRWKCRPEYCR